MAEANYSAGNLEFAVQTISTNTISMLDQLNARLTTTMSLLKSVSSLTKTKGSSITSLSKGLDTSPTPNKKVGAFKITNLLNKIYFLRNYTKQLVNTMRRVVNYGVEYTETLNLWQVAMRNNRQEAEEFVNTMHKAYGISTQTLMNYQAIFRNMLSSLGGLSENSSYALSEYLTQMALDYASLYNTSIEKAMTTFQSVLSGQVRPIRSIAGYDITETTIYQLYQQLGGEKTMRQLTQAEKRLLRLYAVFQQMESSGAVGDLSKTLGSTANQLRIAGEQAKELATWLGIMIEQTIAPALPYINAFLTILTDITKALVYMSGYEPPEYGVESVQELNKELDEIQGKLLSFDRFEALNSGEDDNILGIDEKLQQGLSQYESIVQNVTSKTQELVEKWREWWFIDGDPQNQLTGQALQLLDTLQAIGVALLTIKPLMSMFKFLGKVNFKDLSYLLDGARLSKANGKQIQEVAKKVGNISKETVSLTTILTKLINPATIILALVGTLYVTNENFRDSVNRLFKALSPIFELLGNLLNDILKPMGVAFDSLSGTGNMFAYVIDTISIAVSGLMLVLVPVSYVLEAIMKTLQTIMEISSAILKFNFDGLGDKLGDIWGNWKSDDFAKSTWDNFTGSLGGYEKTTENIRNSKNVSPSNISQDIANSVSVGNSGYSKTGVGDVYLDGKKVGIYTADASHKEQVRLGYGY